MANSEEPAGRPDGLVVLSEGVEILPPDHPAVEVLTVPRPFGGLYGCLTEGRTITEILASCGLPPGTRARVFIDDWLVPPAWWPHASRRRVGASRCVWRAAPV